MTTQIQTTVLVVEDCDEDFDTVVEAASQFHRSHPIRRVVNGDECLEALRASGTRRIHPAVVFLDLNTPGTDGRDALTAIRADPTLWKLPIVILSTSYNPRDVAHCYAHGANAYHVKPVRYPDHLALMHDVLGYWLERVVLPISDEVFR